MDNALKALIMAAEIIITCIIVAFGFYAADAAKTQAAAGNRAAEGFTERLTENSYIVYDGATLSGSELVNLLRYELNKMKGGTGSLAYFEVTVASRFKLTKPEDLSRVTAKTGADYISPYSAFKGEAVWQQGNLVGLRFWPVTQ